MGKETNMINKSALPKPNKIINVKYAEHPEKIFAHRWHAFYKNGIMNSPTIVYGDTEMDAMNAALAEYRRNVTGMSFATMDKVVSYVKPID